MKLADIARSNKDPTAPSQSILTGQYIEPAVSDCIDSWELAVYVRKYSLPSS